MVPLLSSLGATLSQRLVTAMTLPGIAYLAGAGIAAVAGNSHALDTPWLLAKVDAIWNDLAASSVIQLASVAAAILVTATLSGSVATAIGALVNRAWSTQWIPAWLLEQRRSRWRRRNIRQLIDPPDSHQPQTLTCIGDVFARTEARINAQYGLSVARVWPRLMHLSDDGTRSIITDAYRRYRADTTMVGWAAMTTVLTIAWWPAALATAALATIGTYRATRSAPALAEQIEAVVDANQRKLAEAVGVDLHDGRITPADGRAIDNILDKGGSQAAITVPGFVYLSRRRHHRNVTRAFTALARHHGLIAIHDGRAHTQAGSWHRQYHLTLHRNSQVGTSIDEITADLNHEIEHHQSPRQGPNPGSTSFGNKLVSVLQNSPYATVRYGSTILVKAGNEFTVCYLTTRRKKELRDTPELLRQPARLQEILANPESA